MRRGPATIVQVLLWLKRRTGRASREDRRTMTKMEYGVVVGVLLALIATVFVSQYVI